MMKKAILRILAGAAAITFLASCQGGFLSRLGIDNPTDLFESAGDIGLGSLNASNQEKLVVNKVDFAPDYKTFSVWTGVLEDIGPYPLTDSTQVRIEVEETVDGVKSSRRVQPRLVKAWNTESDQIKELGVKILVLVDLSLDDNLIAAERKAVEEMQTAFNQENLFVSFMSDADVTPSREVTDYILGAYFKKQATKKRLYRSILAKLTEMTGDTAPWADAKSLKLIIFSDGKVYDENDEPMDPDHFKMADALLSSDAAAGNGPGVFFVKFGKGLEDGEDEESSNVLTSLCETTGGACLPKFNWTLLENTMLGEHSRAINSNRFDFVNPDEKVYRGGNNQLKLKFISIKENRQVASATAHIRQGSLYRPIIVNGNSMSAVVIEGISASIIIMLVIWLVFHLLVPFIRYRIFLRKYVVKYTGKNMMVKGHAVGESCYLCKADFNPGDEVVVKCEHTMHKTCWDENEYHCPEYGRHCKEGSHFYNREHLLDKRNASFYLNWLLMAVLASLFAWIAFSLWANFPARHILEYIIPADQETMQEFGVHLNQLPSYGFMIGFFLTFGITMLAIRRKRFVNWLGILFRSLLAGIGSALLYLLVSAACIAFHLDATGFLINLIPWILSSYLIAFAATYGTRVKLKKSIILIAVGVSIISMYIWSSFYMVIGVDFRVLLLYSYMIYAIGMTLSIASAAPKSEHYFLHVQGAVKTMDVALYKWFRANPDAIVSIGKSVDCSLQLSWDLQGAVAPVHAEISRKGGLLRLVALEDGVTVEGRKLKVDKYVKLYHGIQFQIGQTQFTYQEKDV